MTDEPAGEPLADQQPDAPHPGPYHRSDPELITAVRGGDLESFGPLYTRHVEAARRLARGLARDPAESDDLVADAFARLLTAMRGGGGPNVAFRAYLLTTVRNLFYDRRKVEGRVNVTDDLSHHDPGLPFVDPAIEDLERMLIARAFARLPERWQTVLWHTQVEGEPPATVATILGLSPNAVATLAYRARERLRQNYLREHVSTSPAEKCRSVVERLGGYVRNRLSTRDRAAVDDHLSGCRRCHVLFLELDDVNAGLRGVLAPAVLGEAAATAYVGSGSAGGITAGLQPFWRATKRISRRRSTLVGAAGAVLAAAMALALALVLTSGQTPYPPPRQPPGAAGAGPQAPGAPGDDLPPPPDQPPVAEPEATEPPGITPPPDPVPAAQPDPTAAPAPPEPADRPAPGPAQPAEPTAPPAGPAEPPPAPSSPPDPPPPPAATPPAGPGPGPAPGPDPGDGGILCVDLWLLGLDFCIP